MAKYYKIFFYGLIVCLISPAIVSASGYPTLFSGRATLTSTSDSSIVYSTEGFDRDKLETSRTKVLVSADNSKLPDLDTECVNLFNLIDPNRKYDCLFPGVVSELNLTPNYYSIAARAHPNTSVYSGVLKINGESVDQESVLVYAGKQANGDIYSKTQDAFAGFTSYGDYLGINNPAVNTSWKVAGYQIDPKSLLYWDNSNFVKNAEMQKNIGRLKGFASTLVPQTKTNLETTGATVTLPLGAKNDQVTPEGKIIWVDGDLNIKATTKFTGERGTIVVTGNLTLTGTITTPADSSLGIVVLGSMTANIGGRLDLRSVIFCPNKVEINRPLFYTGAIVANEIKLGGNTAIVNYDKSLYEAPPPGINYFMTPGISESF